MFCHFPLLIRIGIGNFLKKIENIADRYHGCAHHCFALVWLELTVWPVVSDSTWLGGGVVCVCGGGGAANVNSIK